MLSELLTLAKLVLDLIVTAAQTQRDKDTELRQLFAIIRHANDLYARERFGNA